jgi:hypothetical protein
MAAQEYASELDILKLGKTERCWRISLRESKVYFTKQDWYWFDSSH